MAAGGHLEFWWLDWSKCKNDARNGFSMPKLVGNVVLHSFRYQFVFKLHFQYGHRRQFWILASQKFRRREGHGGVFFSKYFKKLKSSLKPYYALSGHGTPRLHPTILTKSDIIYVYAHVYSHILTVLAFMNTRQIFIIHFIILSLRHFYLSYRIIALKSMLRYIIVHWSAAPHHSL